MKGNNITSSSAGILATGTNNRIEANTVLSCVIGIDVDGTDNLILRNAARANTTN